LTKLSNASTKSIKRMNY